jgi:hypothetical protein
MVLLALSRGIHAGVSPKAPGILFETFMESFESVAQKPYQRLT